MGLTFNKLNHQRLRRHRRQQRRFKKRAFEYRSLHLSPTKKKRIWDEIEKIAKDNNWL